MERFLLHKQNKYYNQLANDRIAKTNLSKTRQIFLQLLNYNQLYLDELREDQINQIKDIQIQLATSKIRSMLKSDHLKTIMHQHWNLIKEKLFSLYLSYRRLRELREHEIPLMPSLTL